MARQSNVAIARVKSEKNASRIPTVSEIHFDFFGLLGCAYRAEPKSEEIVISQNIIDCIATLYEWDEDENLIGFTTEIRALKHSVDDGAGFISGTYLTTLRLDISVKTMSEKDKLATAGLAINLLVLQNFKNLYNNIVGQAVSEFVNLPDEVSPIRWLSDADFNKEALRIPMPLKPADKKPSKKSKSL